jgi:hypothetical protein
VKLLLEAGADPNTEMEEEDGWTPLFIAAQYGDDQIVKLLLKAGANPNKTDNDGATPLSAAAEEDHVEIVKLLLDSGADPNKANNRDRTPLHIASENGYVEIVKLLMEADKFNLNNIKKNADLINILYNSPDVFSDQQYNKIIKTYFKPMNPKTMCINERDLITFDDITRTSSSPSKQNRLLVWAVVPRNTRGARMPIYDCFALDSYIEIVRSRKNINPNTRRKMPTERVGFYYIDPEVVKSAATKIKTALKRNQTSSRTRTRFGKGKGSQKRPSSAVCTRAQKLGVRLTLKRNNKRVYKSEEMLRAQIKNAVNKRNKRKQTKK